jgi:hypothetical protein
MVLILLAALLLLLPPAAGAQCCGDCDGDGQVSINELITAVNNALGQCASGSPTPTALPTDQCPIDFRDDNTQPGTPDCYYIGRWNSACGAADLEVLWRSDGDIVIVNLLGFDPGLFIGADVTGTNTAAILGWFTQSDASDLTDLAGTITLGAMGATLAVDPSEEPFDVDECAFSQYRGTLEDVDVPQAARAAVRARAVNPAALTRLRAAAADKRRASFHRK